MVLREGGVGTNLPLHSFTNQAMAYFANFSNPALVKMLLLMEL